jgi:ABC-2 type transport system ATP-binding protein
MTAMTSPAVPVATSAAVRVDGLTQRFGDRVAVDGLTLDIAPGEIFGLLGPNGAGKTTTIRLLATLLPVQEGRIAVYGVDAAADPMEVRYRLGYVPQQLSIDRDLTAWQNVTWFARLYDVPRSQVSARVREALDMMGLLDVADRVAGKFSGGMVRRLELAQALVGRPALLVLDEPTVGLDTIARDAVWERILSLQRRDGMTVLITTHYMEEADALCDRVGLMADGRLRAVGAPAELKRRLGPDATLEDVFRAYSGHGLSSPDRPDASEVAEPAAWPASASPASAASPVRAPVPASALDSAPVTSLQAAGQAAAPVVHTPHGLDRLALLGRRVGTFSLVELQRLAHDPVELLTRAVQPALWMLIFGQTFSRLHAIPTGKAFTAGVRAVAQVVVIVGLSLLMGVRMTLNPLRLLGAMAVVMLSAGFFSCLSMVLAGLLRVRERLMGIGQAITMPLFFASNALYPIAIMPAWLQALSRVNPLSYEVDALRSLLIGAPGTLWLDAVVLVVAAVAGIAAAAGLLGRLVR